MWSLMGIGIWCAFENIFEKCSPHRPNIITLYYTEWLVALTVCRAGKTNTKYTLALLERQRTEPRLTMTCDVTCLLPSEQLADPLEHTAADFLFLLLRQERQKFLGLSHGNRIRVTEGLQ